MVWDEVRAGAEPPSPVDLGGIRDLFVLRAYLGAALLQLCGSPMVALLCCPLRGRGVTSCGLLPG